MKIRVRDASFQDVLSAPVMEHRDPVRPNRFFRTLLKNVCGPELKTVGFTWEQEGMERLKQDEPCLILMNHSSFIDLKIAEIIFADRPLNIICTSDGFVGKEWLMRQIGCVPTQKFVGDVTLIRDMQYALQTLKSSVLMFPEASYSFDGSATPLPESLGKLLKILKVPVIHVRTYGAFQRDPLYNNLQLRDVKVSAKVRYLLSPEEIQGRSREDINEILREAFTFDHWRWQKENGIRVSEPFRADHLNRVLYKCACCGAEGHMTGKGIQLSCGACGAVWELTEYGELAPVSPQAQETPAERSFSYVTDWYRWERACVHSELENGTYRLDEEVEICVMKNTECIYRVGKGRLVHDLNGFHLTGCDGALDYTQKPLACYSLYSDYYWYELGDMICIGNQEMLYYCFPENGENVAARTRLAVEELYRMRKPARRIIAG
ncbi:MAG: 1-acyl-sn-glycerol-3-phosphate acyltransferase [Lachnospiraceae bacterium]|nr:1-acyl-sn-glycerol-3-phosphate acyltransferase [Lachnospiraceae bacterium]